MNRKPQAEAAAPSLWTTDFILITAVMTLTRICTQVQITSLPLYFQHLGGSITVAGLSMTFFTIAAMLCRPFIGAILDRRGRKPILIAGLIVYTLSTLAYGFITIIPLLILFRVIHGAAFSATSTSTSAMITDVLPEKRMTQGLAYFGLFGTLSIAIAPSMTLYMIDHSTYTTLFIVTAIIGIITLAISLGIRSDQKRLSKMEEHQKQTEETPAQLSTEGKRSILDSFIVKKALAPVTTMLIVAVATSAVSVFLPTYARIQGIPHIGYFFLVQAAALAISSLLIGSLTKRISTSIVIRCSLLAMAVSMISIGFSRSLWEVLLAAALFGFAGGLLMPTLNSRAVLSSTPAERGKASAMFYLALDIGIGTGSAIWGFVSDTVGIEWLFLMSGSLPLLTLFVLIAFRASGEPAAKQTNTESA